MALGSPGTQPPTFEDYLRLLLRRRWWILLPFFLFSSATFAFLVFQPLQYRSETLVLVEEPKVPKQYVVPNVTRDLQDRLQTLTQQILSRTRLQRVIEQFNLYPEARQRKSPEEVLKLMRSNIGVELVQAPGQRVLRAFRVSFTAPNPQLAQQVTSQLTSLFISENLRAREQQAEGTTAFLQIELEKAGERLQEQELKLQEFKSRYLGQLPEQEQANLQNLNGLFMRLQSVHDALNRARQQQTYLESLLTQFESMAGSRADGGAVLPTGPRTVESELVRLRTRRTALLSRYTEQHPEVVKLNEQIEQAQVLLKEMEAELAQPSEEPEQAPESPAAPTRANPAMAKIRSELQANQLEITNLAQQGKVIEDRIETLQRRLQATPIREQQLANILRNYENSRLHYNDLLDKKLQSELATTLEKRQQGEQFRVLDPPSLPVKPYAPHGKRIQFLGILAGLGLGLGLGVLVEMQSKALRTEDNILQVAPFSVWARIPLLLSPAEARGRRVRHAMEGLLAGCMILAVATESFIVFLRGI